MATFLIRLLIEIKLVNQFLYVLKFIIAPVQFVIGNNRSEAILVYIKAR